MAGNSVARGTNDKPVTSGLLADFFESAAAPQDGALFIGYPITTAAEGKLLIDALYVSPELGVVVFDLVEGPELGDFVERQDDALRRLEVRLKSYKELTRRRELLVALNAVTFAPAVAAAEQVAEYPVATVPNLADTLAAIRWENTETDLYRQAVSAVQTISGIRRNATPRVTVREDSRGAILKRLEASIATLDSQQSQAVIEIADDVQRIRGLAGSGKTIVLALKAAYLHVNNPDWKIAVTFNTRSLRDQFRRLINTFTIEQTGDEPDWSMLQILPAWGAGGEGQREGIYHSFCVENGARYYDWRNAQAAFGRDDAFGGACDEALKTAQAVRPSFDAILVDEAQDLPPQFLKMCYLMLGRHKRLVYAYDELQNLGSDGFPTAAEIFGTDAAGRPLVSFDRDSAGGARRDIILEKCYRNSRPVLSTAHALGFGIYREPPKGTSSGLVQMFGQKELWEDIGYAVADGHLEDGEDVTLERTADSSPLFLEDHSAIDDLIQFRRFASTAEQDEWVAAQIQHNLQVDELRPNDIIVINPDPLTTRANVGPLRSRLMESRIQTHLAGVDTGPDVFFKNDIDSVTFTGVFRAKGNEAGMIYVVNAQERLGLTANQARIRNRLFTAITRSKAWVRVVGVGPEMDALIEEFDRARANGFRLAFRYPTERERERLQIVHRELSRSTKKKLTRYERSLSELLTDLEQREVFTEDLEPDTLERLRHFLQARGND